MLPSRHDKASRGRIIQSAPTQAKNRKTAEFCRWHILVPPPRRVASPSLKKKGWFCSHLFLSVTKPSSTAQRGRRQASAVAAVRKEDNIANIPVCNIVFSSRRPCRPHRQNSAACFFITHPPDSSHPRLRLGVTPNRHNRPAS
jgi:hypothetical protein